MMTNEYPRPAFARAMKLIDALNKEAAPPLNEKTWPRVLHGALVAAIIAEANAYDAAMERHRGGAHD